MNVSIWDLDYYFGKTTKHHPDLMRISSYHKQKGDSINFVRDKYDIRRPFDVYYVCKENSKTPNPPADFFVNSKVRWLGKAYRLRRNWTMPDIMMAVRPDYLLYPDWDSKDNRNEQIRLFNNKGELLPRIQDYTNTFKGKKRVVLTDDNIWYSSKENIIKALNTLAEIKNLSFSEPIWAKKIISDKDIKDSFFKLHLTPGVNLSWIPITLDDFDEMFDFLCEIKKRWPHISAGAITLKVNYMKHWDSKAQAVDDFKAIINNIIKGKHQGISVQLLPNKQQLETPYQAVFGELSKWTMSKKHNLSWLEFLVDEYKMRNKLNKPREWNPQFRDLLRQTYCNYEFLLLRQKEDYYPENEVPWTIFEEEFKYNI